MTPSENTTPAAILRGLSADFLQRYNRMGPRYTSYPTVPQWSDSFAGETLAQQVREDAQHHATAPLSLYAHIPFCRQRCRFCACNVIVDRHGSLAETYLDTLQQEAQLFGRDNPRPVTELHLGGGTPTALLPRQLVQLMDGLTTCFTFDDNAGLSLEADPCVTTPEHIHALAALGFTRISYGVQDFHRPTQEEIGRIQTVEETERLTTLAREQGFTGINFDLVYGLPRQTRQTFQRTLREVERLRPDRIALYNFAYLPQKIANQRKLDASLLPDGEEKFNILLSAYEAFSDAGYVYIGMDHFALPNDPLTQALLAGTLQRNFMGYTTQAGRDLYALGTSAISITESLYSQNTRKLSRYQQALAENRLPLERGMLLSTDDRLRRDIIVEIMCLGALTPSRYEQRYGITFSTYFAGEQQKLADFIHDGLLEQSGEGYTLTLPGRLFARNVAMVFDAYLGSRQAAPAHYSRTL